LALRHSLWSRTSEMEERRRGTILREHIQGIHEPETSSPNILRSWQRQQILIASSRESDCQVSGSNSIKLPRTVCCADSHLLMKMGVLRFGLVCRQPEFLREIFSHPCRTDFANFLLRGVRVPCRMRNFTSGREANCAPAFTPRTIRDCR
jgi:hypothetical protein